MVITVGLFDSIIYHSTERLVASMVFLLGLFDSMISHSIVGLVASMVSLLQYSMVIRFYDFSV